MTTLDELKQLEHLSLVSKVTSELSNHLGVSDKVLAEFIIDLHAKSKNVSEFQTQLDQLGAELSASFVENLDRIIRTMKEASTLTLRQQEKGKGKATGNEWETEDLDEERFEKVTY